MPRGINNATAPLRENRMNIGLLAGAAAHYLRRDLQKPFQNRRKGR